MTVDAQRPIIAVGDLVWDVVTKPDRILLPGGDTTGQIALAPGGSAANTAVWIARMGSHAGFVGTIGADVLGDLLAADMEKEQVQLHVNRSTERDTGVILAMIDRDGQRSTVTNQGADFYLLPEDLPEDVLRRAAHIHITAWSLFTDPPRRAAIRAAEIAKSAGATVSFDPASYQLIREMGYDRFARIIAEVPFDMIFPNRDEGEAMTGETEPERVAEELRERYPGVLVALKLDSDGCYVLADNHAAHYATETGPVVDTTGAGDSFVAAFLASYLADGNIARAARFANALGRWVVGHYGARPAVDADLETVRASRFR